jgi:hypothetical protein
MRGVEEDVLNHAEAIRPPRYFEPDPLASGSVRAGAKLITVSHLRQSKVSKSGLSALDLLANIATPHTGQCFIDRLRGVIARLPQASEPTSKPAGRYLMVASG